MCLGRVILMAMQDRYVGDVGDFGKYALLKALAKDSLRLGVIWYLNPVPEANRDGRLTDYSDLKSCDPGLFQSLRKLIEENKRLTREVERRYILPTKLFHREHVPRASAPRCTVVTQEVQKSARQEWFGRARAAVRQADLVFLDPDNGIAEEPQKQHNSFTICTKHLMKSAKYAFLDEINFLTSEGKSVVVYQHQQRRKNQISEQLAELPLGSLALRFKRISMRIYYVLPAEPHQEILRERAMQFSSGVWGRCFDFIS
jgi:hypothetical protein